MFVPLNTAIALGAVAMVLAIAAKMVTGSILNSIQRQLARLHQQKCDLQGRLDHARQRRKTAGTTVAFCEQRKREVLDRIAFAESEIRELLAELAPAEASDAKAVGVHSRSSDVVRRLAR